MFVNGFPVLYRSIKNKKERLERTIGFWLIIHCENIGPTKYNIDLLTNEIMNIFGRKEEKYVVTKTRRKN